MWNTANAISYLRIILAFLIFLFLFLEKNYFALSFFIVAVFTDLLDGAIARSRKKTSHFGKLLDSTADKILILGSLFILFYLGRIKGIFAFILILFLCSRELTILVYRLSMSIAHWDKFKNNYSFPALSNSLTSNYHGKIKMFAESLAVPFLILNIYAPGMIFLFIANIFAYSSFIKIISMKGG
jgi:phosphatidylglycerophosphate synthase